MYDIVYSEKAEENLAKLHRSEPAAFKKAVKLLNELMHHPRTGTGHPESLMGDRSGQWSRIGAQASILGTSSVRMSHSSNCPYFLL